MAYAVWQAAHHSWQPRTTWTSGAYLARLPEARAAVAILTTHPGNPAPLTPACATTGGAPDAKPYPGGPGGCSIPDPTGTGGCITPATAWMLTQLHAHFGALPIACWSARPGDPYIDHSKGRACDLTIGRIGTYPAPADVARGWTIATWLRANAAPLHLSYLIWQGRIWSLTHNTEGWRPYTGGGYYPTTGPSNGHYDHIHVSVTE